MSQNQTRIFVNGEERSVPSQSTVNDLLELLTIDSRRIAVAINSSVVIRSAFSQRQFSAEDRVEILHAVGGG